MTRTLRATAVAAAVAIAALGSTACRDRGSSAGEIRIGQTMPYSGPASAYGVIGEGAAAYVRHVNDRGGIDGRKLELISLDDGYAPPRALEQTRKLVERDEVLFMFGSVGTATNAAVQRYLEGRGVPQLFVATGADRWADPAAHRFTLGLQPSYRVEARIYARAIAAERPAARICSLYQNDDFGKDYLVGLREGLGPERAGALVAQASYEVTDATVDSQVVALRSAGCDVLVTAATPKFAAQVIRKVHDLGWKPLHFMTSVSISLAQVIQPAGPERAVGLMTSVYLKDPADPAFADDPAMLEWRAFMKRYLPDADPSDTLYVYAYTAGQVLEQVLRQCGRDLSRKNILAQATQLRAFRPSLLLPGLSVTTGPADYRPISQTQLARFDGTRFVRLGDVVSGE
jgi:branched-chain amino acid transport system substrate-binding protein